MSTTDTVGPDAVGWAVIESTAQAIRSRFGNRVHAIYALGSLAHGGFSPLVSDVDVAVVLRELATGDAAVIEEIVADAHASGDPLARRLSVFWGSQATLARRGPEGRFPPLDRLDLIRHGVLVSGSEMRGHVLEPSYDDLILGAAEFTLDVLATPERQREIIDGAYTASQGPRACTKVALFPVRFLYTARTGEIGENGAAVDHYLARTTSGPQSDLVRAAMQWRDRWTSDDRSRSGELLASAAVLLYREFVGEYVNLLRTRIEREDLAVRLAQWGRALAS